MGNINAVYLAQSANEGILKKHCALLLDQLFTGKSPCPRGRVAWLSTQGAPFRLESDCMLGVYIDDVGILAVIPSSSLSPRNITHDGTDKVDQAYAAKRFPSAPKRVSTARCMGKFGADNLMVAVALCKGQLKNGINW